MLARLTSLRIFAALVVVLYHLSRWDVASLPGDASDVGYIGVGFFFVLSGFVLAWGTRSGLPARRFYRRRFARVWPSHFVMLVVAALVPVVAVARGWEQAIPNALLVQAWFIGRTDILLGMNGPAWSLSCEAFFYAVFPLLILVLRRIPLKLAWGVAVAGVLVELAACYAAPGPAFTFPPIRFAEFLLGAVAGFAMKSGWRPNVSGPVAGGALVVGLVLIRWLPEPVPNAVMTAPFVLVMLWAARADIDGGPGWLTSRAMVFAGEASFALYLVHEVVIVNLRDHLGGPPAIQAAVLLLLAAAAAVVLHLAVERPFNGLLRDRSPSVALSVPQAAN